MKNKPANFVHYETGIDGIDDDHVRLFELLNGIRETKSEEKYDELVSLLSAHHAKEISLMVESGYNEQAIKAHADSHTVLFQYIKHNAELVKQFHNDKTSKHLVTDAWYGFLHHIEWYDVQYANWLKEKK